MIVSNYLIYTAENLHLNLDESSLTSKIITIGVIFLFTFIISFMVTGFLSNLNEFSKDIKIWLKDNKVLITIGLISFVAIKYLYLPFVDILIVTFDFSSNVEFGLGIFSLILFAILMKLMFLITPWVVHKFVLLRAKKKNQPYALFLRSFKNKFNADSPEGLRLDPGAHGGLNFVPIESRSVIPPLVKALNRFGSVVALSTFNLKHDQDVAAAIQIKTTDESWKQTFNTVSKNAMAIIMIPADTDGVIEEMITLYSNKNLLEKTILFYPPLLEAEFIIGTVSDIVELEIRWDEVRSNLADKGIEIPAFDSDGYLHFPLQNINVPLKESNFSRLAEVLEIGLAELLPKINSQNLTVTEMLKELDEIEGIKY